MTKDQREIQRKLRILRHAEEIGHADLPGGQGAPGGGSDAQVGFPDLGTRDELGP